MLKTRIIPVITWDGMTAVQTMGFKNPRSIGSIEQMLAVYAYRACDELAILDITASEQQREPNFRAMAAFSANIFCPLTIGGGVSSVEHGVELIKKGADKVVIGTHASRGLMTACAKRFGSQSVVAALDVAPESSQEAQVALALWFQHVGAGEIFLTCQASQGCRKGYNLELIRRVSAAVKIPVVAHGGCGHPSHMLDALNAGAHAVAASSMFAFTHWTPRTCAEFLSSHGVKVRLD